MNKILEHFFYVLCALSIGVLGSMLWTVPVAAQCDYYASPAGTGNGLSPSAPFRVSNFWAVAAPGKTLCLLDGEYTGDNSMIKPPSGLKGTSGHPITVRALNDGGARINGQNVRAPVYLLHNDYFVIEGVNAHNSSTTVVLLYESNHNIIRRVCAWDAAEANTYIFGIHYGNYNLIEDCAGWGIARKTFSAAYGGNYTTLRRCWGRWEGSTCVGPKMTYSIAYDNFNMILENCIGTWSNEKMPATYTLMSSDGKTPYLGYKYINGAWVKLAGDTGGDPRKYTNYEVEHPRSIFGNDYCQKPNARMFGCLAYILPTDVFPPVALILLEELDSLSVVNTIAAITPNYHLTKKPFYLLTLKGGFVSDLTASHLTSLGGDTSYFETIWGGRIQWVITDAVQAASITELGSSPYDGSQGARLCYRYIDGRQTSQPLWPWPMNKRIMDAMIISGRNPVDVTKTVEALLGPIAGNCDGSQAPPTLEPSEPMNLRIKQ
jgi:hypothetical protein